MEILPIPILNDNYLWVIILKARKEVIAIDPGDYAPLHHFLHTHQLNLTAVLITHHHRDHTQGLQALLQENQVPVYGPSAIAGVTHIVSEPDTIQPPGLNASLQVINIPGHTLDHIAYYMPGHLFCGDTLFSAGCGRVFEGTFAQMYQSLSAIAALPDDTRIYCTHEYTLANLKFAAQVEPSNSAIVAKMQEVTILRQNNQPTLPSILRQEKLFNPFLRCHVPEVVQHAEQHAGVKLGCAIDVFQHLRQWKDNF